jgi:hypothetical protein
MPAVVMRRQPMLAVDWTEPLLYDLVIDTEAIGVITAVRQGFGLVAGAYLGVGTAGGHVQLARMVGSETGFRRPVP